MLAWVPAAIVVLLLALLYLLVLHHPHVPKVTVRPVAEDEVHAEQGAADDGIPCFDPSSGARLKSVAVCSADKVKEAVRRARGAQATWRDSSFAARRALMRIFSRCILEHAEEICKVSARDSGKTLIDAGFGEVLVTLEKLHWLCAEGEGALRAEYRSAGRVVFYKSARVEWHPRGVIGAIVPWNYPFHNVLNPLTAALFTGNAIVIKVSEHASWSTIYYSRLIDACLRAAGAPADLVQIVTGYAATGEALVESVEKVIFVGSSKVGRLVMAHAAKTLTPVTLELGGKDPLVILQGTDLATVIPTVMRAGLGTT